MKRQGYATEMGSAVIDYASSELGPRELVGFTLHDNLGSQRVLEKLGFVFERHFEDDNGEELALYRRSAGPVEARTTPEG